jgi:hypothetical protein
MRPGRAREAQPLPAETGQRNAPEELAFELLDVPAAVVCANCGRPDCAGCLVDEPTQPSGIVAIIPWERPGSSWLARLWATAKVATLQHRSFFAVLPDGDLGPAFGFAVAAELCAVLGLTVLFGGAAALVLPDLVHAALADAVLRETLLRGLLIGLPALALFMVAVHALHGLALDASARRAGSGRRGRGARFGLYACSWDLVTLPLGLAILAFGDGLGAALKAAPLGVNAPLHAAQAYISGVHGLDADRARWASRRAMRLTGFGLLAAMALGSLALLAWLVW